MKFPIGYSFVIGFLTYEVVEFNENLQNPYKIKYGFLKDEDSYIEMTEGELIVLSNQGV
jgi:hypothetical protein